ncbi:MAG: hypothetical protein PGN34_04660 [Methylobacterium frigidaeris]
MFDVRDQDAPPPPPVTARIHHDATSVQESERLAALLEGVLSTRPSDEVVSVTLAQQNLLVTSRKCSF